MRTAIVILSVVATIAAEAPYHLPRPAPHAPALHYPVGPAPPPQHHHHHHAPPPPLPIQQNSGYNYPQPNFIQPAPQPQYIQPALQPQYNQPAPQPQYNQPAPQPQYNQPAPQPQYIQPAPQPQYIQPAPQPQYIQPAPQPQYAQPAPQPQFIQHQPQPIYQQPAQPQPIFQQPPSSSYGVPVPRPVPQPQPIQYVPQQQPRPQPQPVPAVVYQQQQQFSAQQGYNYQQPQPQFPIQPISSQYPLQSQPLTDLPSNSGLSSYQADSHQYSGAQEQTHREALDSLVVNRVQNIIKESEHTSARDAGYLSLVSGVSLENAKPSVEISSFVHTSPLRESSSATSLASTSGSSASLSGPSADYGAPSVSSNVHTEESSGGSASLSFLPQNKPAIAYGPPN